MSQAPSVAFAAVPEDHLAGAAASPPGKAEHVSLRGTTRGLEILISGAPSAATLGAQLAALLGEAPAFFAGSDARVAFEAALPVGALACLEQVAARFELRLVEIGPAAPAAPAARRSRSYAAVVRRADRGTQVKLAEGTGPIAERATARRGHEASSARLELPSLPGEPAAEHVSSAAGEPAAEHASSAAGGPTAEHASSAAGGPATGGTSGAPGGPAVADAPLAESAAPEAPIEVALANTMPYSAVTIIAAAMAGTLPGAAPDATPGAMPDAMADAMANLMAGTMPGAPADATGVELAEVALDAAARDVSPAEAAALERALASAVPIDARRGDAGAGAAFGDPRAPAARPAAQPAAPRAAQPAAQPAAQIDTPAQSAAAIEATVAHAVEAVATVAAGELAVTEAAIAEAAAAMAEVLAAKRAGELAVKLAGELADDRAAELVAAMPPGPRLVIGPVRSGVIVDHTGHVIVIGDVNPGAEVRTEGSIIVLGRLRGVAHAAIGRDAGCIIALSLQPQQLRIGRMVARAADTDRPGGGAEIAYATGETIVVERFMGRLPSGLAASI